MGHPEIMKPLQIIVMCSNLPHGNTLLFSPLLTPLIPPLEHIQSLKSMGGVGISHSQRLMATFTAKKIGSVFELYLQWVGVVKGILIIRKLTMIFINLICCRRWWFLRHRYRWLLRHSWIILKNKR